MTESKAQEGSAGSDLENFRDMDGTLQLGDTELDGVPYDDIVEQYDSEDVDQIVYHGDASKKVEKGAIGGDAEIDDDTYIEQLEETYENLDELGDYFDADVLTLPGNHAPVKGTHYNDEDKIERIEEKLEEEYGDFSDYEGNAFEFFIDSHDNLVNFVNSTYETEDGNTIIGLDTHMGNDHNEFELEGDVYDLLKSDPDTDDLGYEEDDLKEVAEVMEGENEPDYGLLGEIPLLGGLAKKIGGMLGYGEVDVEPEEIDLEDIPDELKTEEHKEHEEKIEGLEDSEEVEKFMGRVDEIGEMIGEAEGDVMLVHHSTPYSEKDEHGSTVVTEVMRKYGEELDVVTGGHNHGNEIFELGGTDVVNASQTYTEIGMGDKLHVEQYEMDVSEPGPELSDEQRGTINEMQTVRGIEQEGGVDEFWEEHRDNLEERLDQQEMDEDMKQQQLELEKKKLEEIWGRRDEIEEEFEEVRENVEGRVPA